MARSDQHGAARLLERIVADPEFRARYRRDPAAAAREMGVEDDRDADAPLETLEFRESRSSLAGAFAAVAVEGMGFFELVSGHPGPLGPAEAYASARPPVDHPEAPQAPVIEPDPDVADDGDEPDVETGADEPDRDAPDDATDADAPDVGGAESDDGDEPDAESDGDESDDGDAPDDDESDDGDEPGESDEDESDEDEPDEDEPDEDEPDEDEPDEEEPDEEEPDEEEPDEVGADADDLGDDEVTGAGEDDSDDADGGGAEDDSDDADGGDEPDSSDGDDSDDDGTGSDGDDSAAGVGSLDDVGRAYPGDDAPRARTAAWMAAEAKRRGLPPELPVMAALVESGMRNLPGGDADSVGFFQMRASIWDRGEYAGYGRSPRLQVEWFLDHSEAVKRDRLARGLPVDAKAYGEWIADVERPAAQYRGRYQLRLEEARELLRARDVHPAAAGLVDAATDHMGAGPRARVALAEARKFLGSPYQWGGSSPKTGFDCSGLAQWAYAKAGISIPRVTDQQILAPGATKVARRDLLPGDLVFFRDPTGYVHHVGISLGGDRFVHAPHTGDVVKVSSLDEPYYSAQFTGGRRFNKAVGADAEARVMPVIRPDQVARPSGRDGPRHPEAAG